jgi:DNA excision repair protein ERCC-4
MKDQEPIKLLVDSREPWPHPWTAHLSADLKLVRGCLETGDLCVAALPDGAVIERKTVPDLLGCIGKSRDRFERELKRSRYLGRLIVIVEGTLADVFAQSRGIHPSAIIGTLAAWQRRYAPVCFCDTPQLAAQMAESFLLGQVRDIERATKLVAA